MNTKAISSFTFGDVIEFCEDKFVFLAPSVNFVYVARIISPSETLQMEKLLKIHLDRGEPIEEKSIFWFVKLTCEDFRNQWASLAGAQKNPIYSSRYKKIENEKLNITDKKALKKEILEKNLWLDLKNQIIDIEIVK